MTRADVLLVTLPVLSMLSYIEPLIGMQMTSTKANFKKSDVRRAISAAHQEGLEVSGIEILPDGTIRLMFGDNQPNMKNDWD